jgi:hypothetical protein
LAARLVPDRHRRLADEIRPQRPPLGDRRFADSSLEGDRFEPSVPPQNFFGCPVDPPIHLPQYKPVWWTPKLGQKLGRL